MIRQRFTRTPQLPAGARMPARAGGRLAAWSLAWAVACTALAAAGLAAIPAPVHAQHAASQGLERRVKAAFLYKFLGYADFPASSFADATTPVTIGVVGSDEMAAELGRVVAGRQVRGRSIVVRSLREGEQAQGHLLFVAGADNARTARLLRGALTTNPGGLLTVTECELGLQYGSVINFRIIEERVRFDVSLDSAERNNVKLSSRLLTVANRVVKGNS